MHFPLHRATGGLVLALGLLPAACVGDGSRLGSGGAVAEASPPGAPGPSGVPPGGDGG